MTTQRPFYKKKTFYGALAFAILVFLQGMQLELPYEQAYQLVAAWTGYSVFDRVKPN